MDRGQYFSKLSTDDPFSILLIIFLKFGANSSTLFAHIIGGIPKQLHSPLSQQAS